MFLVKGIYYNLFIEIIIYRRCLSMFDEKSVKDMSDEEIVELLKNLREKINNWRSVLIKLEDYEEFVYDEYLRRG